MTSRTFQPGDRVEWDAMGKILHGVVESIGAGKNEGLTMVRQDGYPKSRPVTYSKLRDSKKPRYAPPVFGGDSAA